MQRAAAPAPAVATVAPICSSQQPTASMLAKFSFRGGAKKPAPQAQQLQQQVPFNYPQSAPTSPQKKSPSRQHSYQLPPPSPAEYRQQQQQQQAAPPASPSLLQNFRAVTSPQLPHRRHQSQQQARHPSSRAFELPDTAPQRQTPVWVHDSPVSFADSCTAQQQPPPLPPHQPASMQPARVRAPANSTARTAHYVAATISVATQSVEPTGTGLVRRNRPPPVPQQKQQNLQATVGSSNRSNSSINGTVSECSEAANSAAAAAAAAAATVEIRCQLKKSEEAGKQLTGRFDEAIKRLELVEKKCSEMKQNCEESDGHRSQLTARLDRLEKVGCDRRLASLERENCQLRQELLQAGRFTDELANQIIQNTLIQKNLTEECTYLRERLSEVERVNQQLTTAFVSMLTQTIDPQYLQQRPPERENNHSALTGGKAQPSAAATRLNAVLQDAVTRLTGDSCTHSQCPPAMCCPGDSSCAQPDDKPDQQTEESVFRPCCGDYYTLDFTGSSTVGADTASRGRRQRDSRPTSEVRNRREQSVLNLTATVGSAIAAGASLVAVDLETFLRAREKLDKYRARLNRQAVCSDSELTTDRFLILSDVDEAPVSANNDQDTATAAGPTDSNSSRTDLTISSEQEFSAEPPKPPQSQQHGQKRQPPPVQIQRRRIVQREVSPGTGEDNSSAMISTGSDRSSSDMTPPRSPPPPPPLLHLEQAESTSYQQRRLVLPAGYFVGNGANGNPTRTNGILLPYSTKQPIPVTAKQLPEPISSPSNPTAATSLEAAAVYPSASDDLYIDDDFEVQQPVFGLPEFEETGDEDDGEEDEDDDDDLLREIQHYQLPSSSFA